MAKLLISCDDYIYLHNCRYYFKNKEWENFYLRYLRVFEKIKIANRCQEEKDLKTSRVLVNDNRIEIVNIPVFHGPYEYAPKYFKISSAISGIAVDCDAAILRLPSTIAQRVYKSVKKAKIPYAVEVVFDADEGSKSADKFLEKILWRIIDRQIKNICKSADGVSCVTENHLQKKYFSVKSGHFDSHYSSLSIDKSFYTGPKLYPANKIMNIAHVTTQIHLNGRKGQRELISALELLKQSGIIVNVSFVGEDRGNETDNFMKYAQIHNVLGQVKCLGYLNRDELSAFLDSSDLFVLPTKAEGLPRVIIEAMAKGLPCITTPVSGNPELISEEFLVDYSNTITLADKIKSLVTNEELYQSSSLDNFNKSLAYEASILEARRDNFYELLKARI